MSEQSTDNAQRDLEAKLEQLETADDWWTRQKADSKRLREALFGGPDEALWVMPCDDILGSEVLAEHFQQIRNAVRYALHHAFSDRHDTAVSLNAASTAARLIRTNIALAKALGVVSNANSKTVRSVHGKREPQD